MGMILKGIIQQNAKFEWETRALILLGILIELLTFLCILFGWALGAFLLQNLANN
jgi:hypothetical protein